MNYNGTMNGGYQPAQTNQPTFSKDKFGLSWYVVQENTRDLEATFKRHIKLLTRGNEEHSILYPIILNTKPYLVFLNNKGRVHYYKENVYNLGNKQTVQYVHCRQNNQRQEIQVQILDQGERLSIYKLAMLHNIDLVSKKIYRG